MGLEKYISAFELRRPLFQSFTDKISLLIDELLKLHDIHTSNIEKRTKTIDGFKEKVIRKNYNAPMENMVDISGIRIITYYQDDIDRIIKIIKDEFKVDWGNSVDKRDDMRPSEFGYLSIHLVIELNEDRLKATEWKQFKGFKAEVQVRTVLQHAWASISHALQYKSTYDIPSSLKRGLYRLAGIIELADEEFLSIRKKHEVIKQEMSGKELIQDEKIEINIITINEYFNKSDIADKIFANALSSGFSDAAGIDFDEDDENSPNRDASHLISILNIAEIKSVKELDDILKYSLSYCGRYFSHQMSDNTSEWWIGRIFAVILIVIYNCKNQITSADLVKLGWDSKIADRIVRLANSFSVQ